MIKKILLSSLFGLFICLHFNAQNAGLISYDPEQSQDGYNLFFPHNQGNVYLMDNCGRIVNQWSDEVYRPGNSVYLNEEGLLYACKGLGGLSNEYIHAGGGGELLEIRNFNDELLWQWAYNDSTHRLHHDIAVMPNGNILAIAWERKNLEDVIQAGRDPENIPDGELWPDHILEIQPIYPDEAEIVWEWHAWDHMIQEHDETKDNFGVVADHPELIDVNFTPNGAADWHHMNHIDYNPTLDQIVLSVPTFNEMWIIDHSTTTSQAAGSTGGASGSGGDLIFRWGNPMTYQAGDEEDQQLFYQHDVHWLDIELTNGDPDFGRIGYFNNRTGEDYSTVGIINAVFDSYETGYEIIDGQFAPEAPSFEYQRPDSTSMHSTGLSSFQKLPNENFLICVGRYGYNFEITQEEEIVWEYKNPMISGMPVEPETEININQNIMFSMRRYSPEYAGFEGQTFSPIGWIELSPDEEYICPLDTIVSVESLDFSEIKAFPNPTSDELTISVHQGWGQLSKLVIHDTQGRVIQESLVQPDDFLIHLDVSDYTRGLYMISLITKDQKILRRSFIKE